HLPWRTSFILGTNSAFPLFKGMLRVYVENEYLVENAYWLWNINDKYHENFKIDNIYGYSQYPYYYYNKIIGSPLGGEAKALNLGAIYTHP
ncbi:hypothetical protein, partial [Klebsiella pneumoniae]|uniref:hypothetical protein n=1 Tax=Klebsiella pneumoniae TaxID=573 RepID=UPI001D0EFCEB